MLKRKDNDIEHRPHVFSIFVTNYLQCLNLHVTGRERLIRTRLIRSST